MTDDELLALATRFELLSYDPKAKVPRIYQLTVERRTYATDPNASWAICDGMGYNLNYDGKWEHELRPSEREDDFLKRCRWPDLREAVAFAQEHMRKYPTGYKPED